MAVAAKGLPTFNHLFVGGYDVAVVTSGGTLEASAVMDPFFGVGTTMMQNNDSGERDGTASISGLLNSPTSDPVAGVSASGSPSIVSFLIEGDTIVSNAAPGFWGYKSAIISKFAATMAQGNLHRFSVDLTSTGNVHYGRVIGPNATRSTAGDTKATYVTMPYTTGFPWATGHAFVHVTAVTGAPTNLTVTITTSVDHTTWIDQAATAVFTTPYIGAQYLTLVTSPGVQQYVAMKWAWSGGTAPTWTGFVGVAVD